MKFFARLVWSLEAEPLEGVDSDDAEHSAPEAPGGLEGDGPSHGMADEYHPAEIQALHDGHDVLSEAFRRPDLPVRPGFAVAGEIDRHDRVSLREERNLVLPVPAVAAPAVYEDERRLAAPLHRVPYRRTVRGDGLPGGRRRAARGGGEDNHRYHGDKNPLTHVDLLSGFNSFA